MAEVRTDEEKAQAFAAMTGSISVIDNTLDDSNEFCNDLTKAGKKERVMRSAAYMKYQKELDDWGQKTSLRLTLRSRKQKTTIQAHR